MASFHIESDVQDGEKSDFHTKLLRTSEMRLSSPTEMVETVNLNEMQQKTSGNMQICTEKWRAQLHTLHVLIAL